MNMLNLFKFLSGGLALQFALFLSSCQFSEQKNSDKKNSHPTGIHYDTTRIFIPYEEKPSNFGVNFIWQDSAYIASGSCPDSVMHIWNLKRPEGSYNLRMPLEINWCTRAAEYFITPDSIYALNAKGDFMLFSNRKWGMVCNVNEQINGDGLWVNQYLKPFEFFVENDSILYFAVQAGCLPTGQYAWKTYHYPLTAKFNYKTKSVKYIGPVYPKQLEKGYTALSNVFQHFYNGKIFYSSYVLPQIWEYDMIRDTLIMHDVRSKYQTEGIKAMTKEHPDMDEVTENVLRSGRYREFFIYDQYKRLYYWFYELPLPERNEKGYFNTFSDKRISVMVIDAGLNIIAEELLPKECSNLFYYAVSKDGLFINCGPVADVHKHGVKLLKISLTDS